MYHITARGNERRRIFRGDADHEMFLATVGQCVEQHGLRLHGYCLMPNHYHLLLETPRGNLSRAIGWLQTAYTIRFNVRHQRSGHLFQGRFKAHLVEADAYAMTLLRYVHLNPVRPRMKTARVPADRRKALAQYRWSSHRGYLGREAPPDWLCVEWLSFFGRTRHSARREYERFVGEAFETAIASPWEALRSGLVLGGDTLHERARLILKKKPGNDELAWTMRQEQNGARAAAAQLLASHQSERTWKAWVLARHGNERGIDIARQLGYKDGSAITHIIQRHAKKLPNKPAQAQRIAALEKEFDGILSRFKS